MSATFLPYGRQHIDDDDIDAVVKALRSDFLTSGPLVGQFESELGKRITAEHVSVCSSGTAALHLAMLALGVGEGDVVIVPTLTFLASANAPRYVGAEVAFADVDPQTGLLTTPLLEEAIARARRDFPGKRLRAVVAVHLNGQACDMPEIARLARKHQLFIVEDACHALGTKTQMAGATETMGSCLWSDCACFSFHPVKTVAMGEGGAVVSRDAKLIARVNMLRNHGMTRDPQVWSETAQAFTGYGEPNPWYYEMPEIGFNYRATDIQCALGLSQLAKFDGFAAQRRALAAHYNVLLAGANDIKPVPIRSDCDPCLHLYVVHIDFAAVGRERAKVMAALRARGIGTQVHYLPVHRQPYYRNRYGALTLMGGDIYYARALSLPFYPRMTTDDISRVVSTLQDVLRGG